MVSAIPNYLSFLATPLPVSIGFTGKTLSEPPTRSSTATRLQDPVTWVPLAGWVHLVSRARHSLWAELAGREKERLVTHVNIPQRLCQDSSKTTSKLSRGVR